MAILDIYNRKRGVIYVYDSVSYWDKELRQPRSRRRLLGRRDPDTGELIPTRKQKKATAVAPASIASDTDYIALYKQSQEAIRKKDIQLARLRQELADARHRLAAQAKGIASAVKTLNRLNQDEERHNA